jgi:hypothetical protein
MGVLLIFSVLFFIGLIYNLVVGDYPNAGVDFAVSAALFGSWVYFVRQEEQSEQFLAWIYENQEQLNCGQLRYDNKTVTSKSEVVRFQTCFSLIIFSFKSHSSYLIRGQENVTGIALLYSLVAFFFGWWGIPWGPVYTFQVLAGNFRGGEKRQVKDLIDDMNLEMEKMDDEE